MNEDSEIKYYFLGLVAADGWISDKSNRIELTLKESDVTLLRVLRDLFVPGKPLVYKEQQHAYRLTLDNKEIHDSIMLFFNTTDKTRSLMFPYGIPDKYIKHYIRGYIDGDGNIDVKKGQRKLANGNINYYYGIRLRILGTRLFLEGLQFNIKRLQTLTFNANPHKKDDENVYYIEYGFSAARSILDWCYDDASYYLERKKQVYLNLISMDSNSLEKRYGTPDGCYNMLASNNNVTKDIVGTNSNIG